MKKSILFLFLLIFNIALAQDIATIKQRLKTTYKSNPSKSTIDSALALMDASGGFTDLNYLGDTDLRVHLNRINSLASAYINSSNLSTYYNNSTIKQKYYLSLGFWITTNHTPTNWWYRQIAYPKEVSKGFVLLADNLKVDNLSLYDSAVSYLMWGYNQNAHMDGANISDTVIGALGAAVCESNTVALGQFKDWIDSMLLIDDAGEGFGADYMFAQHSGYGRQINTTSYGNEMYKSVLSYIEATNATVYGVTYLSNLENGVLKAYQWITFKNHYDPSTSGRDLNSSTSIAEIVSLSDRMLTLNSPQKTALTTANLRIKGANTLVGNSMFWRLDYMIHRNLNYMMSTRMTSTRTVSTESDGSSVGIYNYYSGAGANYVTVTGSEYDGSFFTNFNYRQFPGTTAEQDAATLPLIAWGQGGTNGNAFAGGVSNGTIGCSGMIWNKRKVTAYKSWFFFPDETVALGSGVTETGGTANVYTTLNQTNFNATEGVSYSKGGVVTTTKTATNFNVVAPSWFYHGSIGYANLDTSTTQSFAVNTNNSVVSIAADHGLNPSSKKYSYVILPNTTLAGMPTLVTGLAGKIVVESNTAGIQAVTHNTLHTTQIVFSTSGSLTMATGDKITVNGPCALILDRVAGKIYVSNPRAESAGTSVLVTYLKDGVTASNTIVFPTGNLSGSTVNFTITPMTTTGSETVSACGTSYTWPLNGQSYTASGSYEYVVGNNIATLTLTLTSNTTVGSQSVSACGTSYTWPLNGQSYTSSGTYTHVVECNTATLELTLTPNTTVGSQSVSACGTSYTWPLNGQSYTASGTYTYVVGCNTATLILTLTPNTTVGNQSVSACGASYTWPLNGQSYTASGTYTHVVGCNTATLTLTLTPNTTDGSQSVSACGTSYTWPLNGQSYTSSGTYTRVVGCNTATLTLTLTPNTTVGSQSVSACGTSYTWPLNGQSYTSPGTYMYVEGCNTATLTLTFTPSTTVGNQTVSTCGASYIWPLNGQTYTSSGTYTHVVGCNTATLTLTLIPKTTVGSQTVSVCGTYYTWPLNGQSYTSSGTYTRVVGCNTATLILTLTLITTIGSQSVSACGTSYTWPLNGQSYTSSGTYTHVVGCNTATLTLTLTPAANHTTTVSAFNNYTWANSGQTYTTGGIKTGTTANCVTELLDLTVSTNPIPTPDKTYSFCTGAKTSALIDLIGPTVKVYASLTGSVLGDIPLTGTSKTPTAYYLTETAPSGESARVRVYVVVNALPATPSTLVLTNPASLTPDTAVTALGSYAGTNTPFKLTATATGTGLSYRWALPTGVVRTDVNGSSTDNSTADTTADFIYVKFTGTGVATPLVINVQSVNASDCTSAIKASATLTRLLPMAPGALAMNNGSNTTAITSFAKYMGTPTVLRLSATAAVTANSYLWELPTGVNRMTALEGGSSTEDLTSTDPFIYVNFAGVTLLNTATNETVLTTLNKVLRIGVKSVNGVGVSVTPNAGLLNPTTTSTAKLLTLSAVAPAGPTALVLNDPNEVLVGTAKPKAITVISKFIEQGGVYKLVASVPATTIANRFVWELPACVTRVTDLGVLITESADASTDPFIFVKFNGSNPLAGFVYFGVKAVNGIGSSVTSNSAAVPATSSTAKLLKLATVVPAVPTALTLNNGSDVLPITAITIISKFVGQGGTYRLATAVPATTLANSFAWELPACVTRVTDLGGLTPDETNTSTTPYIFVKFTQGATALPGSIYFGVKAVNSVGSSNASVANVAAAAPYTGSEFKLLKLVTAVPAGPTALVLNDLASATPTTAVTVLGKYIGKTTKLKLTTAVPVTTLANYFAWTLPTGVNRVDVNGDAVVELTSTDPYIYVNFAGITPPNSTTMSIVLGVNAVNNVGASITVNATAPTNTAKLLTVTAGLPAVVATVTPATPLTVCNRGIGFNYTITAPAGANYYEITAPIGSVVTSVSAPSNGTNVLTTSDLTFKVVYGVFNATDNKLVIKSGNAFGLFGAKSMTMVYSTTCPTVRNISDAPATDDFSVIAYPNPSSDVFTLDVQSSSKGATGVQVYDMAGRLIENRQVNSNSVDVGRNYASGVYNVIVNKGAQMKTLRVIKR